MPSLVTLVNTNQVKPAIAPIAFDYLQQPLEEAGFELDLLDLCFAEDVEAEIAEYCAKRQPDFWGVTLRNTDDVYFSSGFAFLPQVRRMVECLRRSSRAPIIFGGVGFSVMPRRLLRFLSADYGIVREGEVAFPLLLDRLRRGEDPSDIPGLVHWRDGEVAANPIEEHADLVKIGVPPRTLVDNRRYFAVGGQAGIETKRGCNRRCIYCVEPLVKGRQVRFRSPNDVVDEIEALLDQGVHVFHVNDSEFNLAINHAIAICDEICKRGLGDKIEWYAYGMPAPFPDRLASAMKAAGCAGMNFGTDSASPKMLEVLDRTFTREDIRNAVATVKRHGLDHIIELLFGAPGETRETVRETIEFIKEIDPRRVSVTLGLRIFPGTLLERMIREEGFTQDNPGIQGPARGNDSLLEPVFYVSPALGAYPMRYIAEVIGDDDRFFGVNTRKFNYNANDLLVDAIRDGERGAFWSILTRIEERMKTDPAFLPLMAQEKRASSSR